MSRRLHPVCTNCWVVSDRSIRHNQEVCTYRMQPAGYCFWSSVFVIWFVCTFVCYDLHNNVCLFVCYYGKRLQPQPPLLPLIRVTIANARINGVHRGL